MAINLGKIEEKNQKNKNYKNIGGLQISTDYVDVPIIPKQVKQTTNKKKQNNNGYFKKSKGNTGQAIGYSALDALGNFTEGSLNFFEGMSDSARYAGANVLDFFGADKKAEKIRKRARDNDVEDIVNQWNHITAGDLSGTKSEKEIGRFKKVEDNSIFGEKSDQVIQGVGNSLTGAAVGSYLGAPITGVGKGANLARNVIGLTSFGSSAAGHATTEAYNEGANDFQAGVYGILNGAVEAGSEMLFGGLGKINKSLGFGTGALDDIIVKKLTKNIGNTLFRNIATIGLKSAGEGVEEIASLIGDQLVRRMMNMDSKTLKELAEDGTLADTFVQGTLSSLISQAPSGISSTVQGRDYTTGLTRTQQQYVNEIAQQRMVEAQRRNARLNGMQKSQIEDRALTDYQRGRLADANKLEQVNLPGLSTKDMDLQQSAYKYGFNPNSEAIVTAKTMLDNRGIKSRFDADAFKNINGNAYWTNKNGVREVIFNPNASEQAILEEIAIHELTHDLMSSKNSKSLLDKQNIIDYVSTLKGYKESRAKLEDLYSKQTKGMNKQKATDLINEEIVADTLGKNIGSQEYIRRLIDDEPSIAKNIYDWVVNKVANKNGVKNEKAYWNNVKNNFEKAYNMEYQGKGSDTRHSFMSEKGLANAIKEDKRNQVLANKLAKAKELQKQGYSNEQIRQRTLWFQDPNGKWLFEIADLNSDFIVPLKEGMSKNVEELFKHDDLFEAYPQLRTNKIKVKPIKPSSNGDVYGGETNPITGTITLNSELLKQKNGEKILRKVLLHELQHQIQIIEGLEKGDNGKNAIRYYSSLGEIQSTEVEDRSKMTPKELKQNAPEVSKQYPIHSFLKKAHEKPNSKFAKDLLSDPKVAELYNEIYNNGNEGEYERAKINRMGTTKDVSAKRNVPLLRGRGHTNGSSKSIYQRERETIQETIEGAKETKAKELDNSSFYNDLIADAKFHNAEDLTEVTTGYENVPDNLLGFSSSTVNNKGYNEEKYKYKLDLMISFDDGKTYFEDSIKGLNKKQAIERARRNWGEDAILKANPSSEDTDIRYSLSDNKGYHYGDLGKARDTNFFSMRSSRRSTGHFGHGTYFLGNKENVGSSSKGSRTLQEVDFSDYNLFKPLIENQAWRLHDGLKAINNEDYGNFDIELMKDVFKSYGISQESIDKAIEKTMDYSIKLDSKNYEEQLEADSPSTVFMKALGYEGIDVRGLDGLDNTSYGSVIYDLKKNNSLSEQLENQANEVAKKEIAERQAMIELFEDYLSENDITNPTEQDIYNSLDAYDVYDANESFDQEGEKKYFDTIKKYLKEQNQDVRYSLTDNQGRELTKEQQEFFKDSKVRDSEGRLLEVYHGSENEFNIFDIDRAGARGSHYTSGFYFTNSEESAKDYATHKGKVYKTYLNITNPYIPSADIINKDGSVTFAPSFYEEFEQKFKDKLPIDWKELNSARKGTAARYILQDMGYDGVINGHVYVAFEPNQIKNVDNTNPTDDADIRYSLSTEDLKQKQLDIILKNNPVEDDYHTWIRSIDDIKTYEEALQEDLDGETQDLTPDFKKADLEKALETGKMTVYSSYPIEQGIFVTPSKMEAQSYAGSGKVYSKEINLDDVAWIDTLQGQYARVQPSDIRNSQQTEGWQSFLDKNFEAKGTKTRLSDIKLPGLTKAVQEEVQKSLLPITTELKELNKNLNKVLNPTEISQLTPQDANTTPILPGVNRNKVGDGKSKFFDNINEKTNMLNDEQKTAILSNDDVKYYDKVTNKDSLDKAFERLQEGGAEETRRWFNKDVENADATDVAEGWILLKQYADNGQTADMVEVAKKLRNIGTKAGQTVQAFNILSRLTPEGMVKYAQSELLEAYDQMVKNKSKAWIDANRDKFDLKPNEVAFIMDTMKDVSTMEDGYDKRFKLAQIQKVLTDKLPPAKGAGMKAWMRISMLFNPKTQVRNVAGNALIAPVNAFGDMFASLADKAIGSKTGVRTTGNFNLKDYTSGMKKGLYESYNDFKHGVNTRNVQGNRFEVTEGKSFNDNNAIGKALNKVDSILSFVLDAGDRGFYEASFVNSINNQMVLNNTTEVTQDMIDIATQEALSRTWQDNNEYTKFVIGMRNELNRLVHVNGYGLGDVLIPFAKTPANLTKAIVDYSPVGLVSAINKGIKLNRSLTNGQYNAKTQHEFVQSLGKATAGTILYVLGYALAQAGITSGASDEDKDVANFLKNTLGKSSYSIQIGGKTFTYDWAQPIAAPLSMMANLVQKEKEGATLAENITTTLDTGLNLLFEQSFLESMSNVFSQPGEIGTKMIDQFLDLPSRAVPTLFKQIADLVDGTQRQTYVKDKPIESMVNEVKAKIPGLSQTLAPSVDTLGREIQKYGGKNNLFNVFLNPANVNAGVFSESGAEIYRLYKETGETNIMPRVAPYYVNKKGEKIVLDTKQRAEYQKVSGSIIENNVAKLLESTEYKNMSDKDKASVVNDIVNYSYNIAQNQVLGTELSKDYVKAYEYSQIGDISDYYEFRNSIDDTNSKTERESVFNYLYNSDLDDNQIAKLYRSCNYSTDKTINAMLELRIPMKEFVKYDTAEIEGKYNPNTGKTINGSKKNAIIEYVNGLNLSKAQKAILIKGTNTFNFDTYNNDIIRYVNTLNGSVDEKKVLLKSIGFDNYDRDVVRYIKSQGLSQEETEKKLKDLGFTIRDGRVYY